MRVEELLQGIEHVLAVLPRLVNESVSLFDGDDRVGRRGRAGMPAEGVDVPENGERVDQLRPRDHRAHRHVAGGERFRHRHDVRFDPVVLAGEPGPGATEPGDHLVDDQQDAIAVADLADAPEIRLRRGLHAVRLHDRLGDECRHVFRAFMLDLPLQIVGTEREVRLFFHAERVAVAAWTGDQGVAGNAGL